MKAYFLPHLRSKSLGISRKDLVTDFMKIVHLEDPWSKVVQYLQSPSGLSHKAYVEIVAVDCVAPSKNRVKVYIRTQASSLDSIIDLMTLGGMLSNPSVLSTIETVRHLWRLLFGDIQDNMPVPSSTPGRVAYGFLVYFEMALGVADPAPKVYIPVIRYCRNDGQIAEALAQYYGETGLPAVADRYIADAQNMWCVQCYLLI